MGEENNLKKLMLVRPRSTDASTDRGDSSFSADYNISALTEFCTKQQQQQQPKSVDLQLLHPATRLAASTANPPRGLVAQYFDERNPAVMKGLETLIKAAKKKGKCLDQRRMDQKGSILRF